MLGSPERRVCIPWAPEPTLLDFDPLISRSPSELWDPRLSSLSFGRPGRPHKAPQAAGDSESHQQSEPSAQNAHWVSRGGHGRRDASRAAQASCFGGLCGRGARGPTLQPGSTDKGVLALGAGPERSPPGAWAHPACEG